MKIPLLFWKISEVDTGSNYAGQIVPISYRSSRPATPSESTTSGTFRYLLQLGTCSSPSLPRPCSRPASQRACSVWLGHVVPGSFYSGPRPAAPVRSAAE